MQLTGTGMLLNWLTKVRPVIFIEAHLRQCPRAPNFTTSPTKDKLDLWIYLDLCQQSIFSIWSNANSQHRPIRLHFTSVTLRFLIGRNCRYCQIRVYQFVLGRWRSEVRSVRTLPKMILDGNIEIKGENLLVTYYILLFVTVYGKTKRKSEMSKGLKFAWGQ